MSALITVVADCYLARVPTRRVDKLVKTLEINALSKSQVSGWPPTSTPRSARSVTGLSLVTAVAMLRTWCVGF